MRIFDLVMVTSEKDLDFLEARFIEYQDLNVTHVIAECTVSLDKKPKDLFFWDSPLFQDWHGRWTHVQALPEELPVDQDAKIRKEHLREMLLLGLSGEDDDLVLHGNIDEFPSAWVLPELEKIDGPVTMEMDLHAYRPGLVHSLPWRGTTAVRHAEMRQRASLTELRRVRKEFPAILGSGHRLTYMGEECPDDMIYPDGGKLFEADIDETFPKWFREKNLTG